MVIVDTAGAIMGGSARFKCELDRYLKSTGRPDVKVLGADRRVTPAWLVHREATAPAHCRRVALNNVSFVSPGGPRWTLLRNPLHFLSEEEKATMRRSLRIALWRQAPVVRWATARAEVLVTPTAAMADRVTRVLPGLRDRIIVRPHPVSVDLLPDVPEEQVILCPVLASPYKDMAARITAWLSATEGRLDPDLRLVVTGDPAEYSPSLAHHPRIQFAGRLNHYDLRQFWARCRAVYFPTSVESFGYPLAEARAYGKPVIGLDTPLNREVAGPALHGFSVGDPDSLWLATERALTATVTADPAPFDPTAYFDWLLGAPQ